MFEQVEEKGAELAGDFDVETFPADLKMHKEEQFTGTCGKLIFSVTVIIIIKLELLNI